MGVDGRSLRGFTKVLTDFDSLWLLFVAWLLSFCRCLTSLNNNIPKNKVLAEGQELGTAKDSQKAVGPFKVRMSGELCCCTW